MSHATVRRATPIGYVAISRYHESTMRRRQWRPTLRWAKWTAYRRCRHLDRKKIIVTMETKP